MSQPPYPPQQPSTPQGPPPPQPGKKSSIWKWVAIGCGGILLLGALAAGVVGYFVYKAAQHPEQLMVKAMLASNSEIELVSSDTDKGTYTFRNKNTGEVVTIDAQKLKEGKLEFSNSKGEKVSFDGSKEGGETGIHVNTKEGESFLGAGGNIPSWIPVYPGTKMQSTLTTRKDGQETGVLNFSTSDSVEKVKAHYESALKSSGYQIVNSGSMNEGADMIGTLTARNESQSREIGLMITQQEGKTNAVLSYKQGK